MTRKTVIACSVTIAVFMIAAAFERKTLLTARAQHVSLKAQNSAALLDARLATLHSSAQPSAVDQEALRALPALRNQVRQLRMQKEELEKLAAENKAIQKRVAEASVFKKTGEATPEQGFAMNTAWSNAGLGSPEAAIQTFFAALRDADVATVLACLTPDSPMSMGLVNSRTGELRMDVFASLRAIAQIKGYRIAQLQPEVDDRMTAKLQAAVDGALLDFRLRRIGQQWRIDRER
jgi:hypothetical protein